MSKHRGFLWFTGLALALSAIVGLFLWHWVQATSLKSVETAVSRLTPIMSIARLALIALVAGGWNPALHFYARYARYMRLDIKTKQRLMALRWRVVIWMMVLELVIGQEIHFTLFAAT